MENSRKSVFGRQVCIASILFGLVFATTSSHAVEEVLTNNGLVRGELDSGVLSFRGIPYAAAPIGNLRFRAPAPMQNWRSTLDATRFGPACVQEERPGRPLKLDVSEDCLTLNIWAKPKSNSLRPVMVWIHGGAFRFGSGALPYYDGTEFAKRDVVLVTFNYRLGRFGFFSHPALVEERDKNYPNEPIANYGLMDQIALLQWIQSNIERFGGDPQNVTIFGESAGGLSVNYLMASPLTEGLFHRAISQSGGGFVQPLGVDIRDGTSDSLNHQAERWVQKIGLETVSSDTLRSLSIEDMTSEWSVQGLGFGPVVDGDIVVDDVGRRFAGGHIHAVPYMAGANSFEASLMKATKVQPDHVLDKLGSNLKAAQNAYRDDVDINDLSAFARALYGDAAFVAPARNLVASVARSGSSSWLYHFAYVPVERRNKVPGAAHGSDVPFVFGSLNRLPMSRLWVKSQDRAVSDHLLEYWTQFAKFGNPNQESKQHWPRYQADQRYTLLIDSRKISAVKNLYQKRLDFQHSFYESSRLGAGKD